MRIILTALLIITLSGCSMSFLKRIDGLSSSDECLTTKDLQNPNDQCNITPWVDYWMQASTLNWKEREKRLGALTNTPADRVKIILLSNVPNTPYQSRLRAQLVARQFTKDNKSKLAEFINLIIFLPAQEKLELESALATQTDFNIEQEKQLQEQSKKLSEQAQQINQLLEIEKNIVDKPANDRLIEVTP